MHQEPIRAIAFSPASIREYFLSFLLRLISRIQWLQGRRISPLGGSTTTLNLILLPSNFDSSNTVTMGRQ